MLIGIGVGLAGILAVILFSTTSTSGPGSKSSAGQGGVNVSGATFPGIAPATANLLALSPYPASGRPAPDFRLTDQRGRPVSLSQFRGQSVVLSFNDDHCTDVCTLLAEDVVRADEFLGAAGRSRVAFLSVNVNPFYPDVQDVTKWSDDNALGSLPNWYFSTGSVADLQAIWKAYGVFVGTDAKDKSVTHGTVLDFIGPSGNIQAVGDFGLDAVDVDPYSHGMAQMAVDLLPGSQRISVAGPQASGESGTGAGLGQQAPEFHLPILGRAGQELDLAAMLGQPVVLNFWASSCPDCRDELAAFAQVAKEDPKIRFVGIDVADPSGTAAASLARQAGIAYPVAVDHAGQAASGYRIAGLPTTIFLNAAGKVAVFHPGALSAEQLRYTLAQFFPGDAPEDH
jgi:cytochrome oxidase Cu insertion factor (SCO1/SenC/PrrC family)